MHEARQAVASVKTAVADPLAVLQAIDRLTIGPVAVEPDGLRAPYRVDGGEGEDRFVLEVWFEQQVFDPTAPEDQNLAAMIAAQPVVSYGLFCREMLFAGPHDAADRQFLRAMMSKMARESFVQEILGPKRCLAGEVRALPSVHPPDFVRARVVFEPETMAADDGAEGSRSAVRRWPLDRDRYAVLSNGGKSSLLSYGLLEELGVECHPIFVSGSERHGRTVDETYDDLRRRAPQTALVRTNAGRLAGWLLEHLTFLRPDLRPGCGECDPSRLWTMPFLSFAALPLLRRRRIGRLVRGGAYDTTRRTWRDGIQHHDGLYDRSHYVDRALTRYFRSKGWGMTHFSLLRTLSELLIERILAERYPHLLALQLSCQNPRGLGGQSRPCGRCDECRGAVAMLLAVDTAPSLCGYRQAEQEAALAACRRDGLRQELAAVEHLAYLLHARGVIPEPKLGNVAARERWEIEKLRLDSERSPLNDIPKPLRLPLLEIFLDHGEGAILHTGFGWVDVDGSELDRLAASETPHRRPRRALT